MKQNLLNVLRCPDCLRDTGLRVEDSTTTGANGVVTEGNLTCEGCRSSYPVVDGIPVLLPADLRYDSDSEVLQKVTWIPDPSEHVQSFIQARFHHGDLTRPILDEGDYDPHHWLLQQKINQRDFCDIPWDRPYTRPYQRGKVFEYVGYHALRLAAARFGTDLSQLSVLNTGCGHGFEAEYLANSCGVRELVGTDISLNALRAVQRRAQLYRFDIELICADLDHLPLVNNSFQLALCHEALHHIPVPQNSIVEMSRVAKNLMLVNEPAENFVRNTFRAVSRIGRQDYETSGNYSHHFLAKDLNALCRYIGFGDVDAFRCFTICPQEPPKYFGWFENRVLFWIFRRFLEGVNGVFGKRFGNKLSCIAKR